jgi:hypothetical protein
MVIVYIIWLFGIFFPVLVCCSKKNLANLKQMTFSVQMVPNSCATHALVSILLNLPRDNLVPILRSFVSAKKFSEFFLIPEYLAKYHSKTVGKKHFLTAISNILRFTSIKKPQNQILLFFIRKLLPKLIYV